jgi:hypothetical protein
VPDEVAGLRAVNARLRELLAERDAEAAGRRAGLEAEREARRRLALRLAELERRLSIARWCRIRSYLDSAAAHGITALDAIRDALTGKPWLPPLPAAT